MDSLPAMAWSEEKLEAGIGRLAQEAGGDLMARNAEELHNLYITQRLTGGDIQHLDVNPMSEGYPDIVKSRVAEKMNRITNGTMPFMEWGLSKQSYSNGREQWPQGFVYPRLL